MSVGGLCRRPLYMTSDDDISITSTFEQKNSPFVDFIFPHPILDYNLGRLIVGSQDA